MGAGGETPMGPFQADPVTPYPEAYSRVMPHAEGFDERVGLVPYEHDLIRLAMMDGDRDVAGVFTEGEIETIAAGLDRYVEGVRNFTERCSLHDSGRLLATEAVVKNVERSVRHRYDGVLEFFEKSVFELGLPRAAVQLHLHPESGEPIFVGRIWELYGVDWDPSRKYQDVFALTPSGLAKELYHRIPLHNGGRGDATPEDISGAEFAAALNTDTVGELKVDLYRVFSRGLQRYHLYFASAVIPPEAVTMFVKEKFPPPPPPPPPEEKTGPLSFIESFFR